MNVFQFFRSAHDDDRDRLSHLRRSLGRDLLLYAGNRALQPVDRLLVRYFRRRRFPIAFIVGAPRTGTTLLYQLMARHLDVGYVSNFMARFWMAPVVGAVVDRRLRRRAAISLESDYGRTRGRSSPHELTWFWKHRLDLSATDALSDAELARVDAGRLRDELLAVAGAAGRPFVWKSVNFVDYHVGWLHALLPDARFLWLRRDALAVACSILRARRAHYGDPRRWWSLRPRDVDEWRRRPWAEQIAHQIRDVEAAIERQLAGLPPAAGVRLSYEELVADPESQIRRLARLLAVDVRAGAELAALELEPGGRGTASEEERATLARALGSP